MLKELISTLFKFKYFNQSQSFNSFKLIKFIEPIGQSKFQKHS